MAEPATSSGETNPMAKTAAAAPAKTMQRIRFQRAKPNVAGIAGRRQAGPPLTTGVSVTVANPPVTPAKIQPISTGIPPPSSAVDQTTVAKAAVELQVVDRTGPPPVRRLLPSNRQSVSQPAELSTDRMMDLSNISSTGPEGLSSNDAKKSMTSTAISTTSPSSCSVPSSSAQQSQPELNDDNDFIEPSAAAVVVSKPRERKMSSRDVVKEVTAPKRPKKYVPEKTERNQMTMFDFIHWNPESNPMVYNEDECMTPLSNRRTNDDESEIVSQRLVEEDVDNPTESVPALCSSGTQDDASLQEQSQAGTTVTAPAAVDAEEGDDFMPVPRVKIGPDGNIILDEQSLVIETTASKTNLGNSSPVYEHSSNTNYSSYRRKKPCKNWSEKETARFYIALSSVGTDFSLMENFFPKRSRHELKLKFKREERLNRSLVEKAINDRQLFDISLIEDEVDDDEENEIDTAIQKAKSVCRRRRGGGKASKRGRKRKSIDGQNDVADAAATASGADATTATVATPKNTRKRRKYKRRADFQIESDSDEAVDAAECVAEDDGTPKRKKKASQKKKGRTKENSDEALIGEADKQVPDDDDAAAGARSSENDDSDDDIESDEIVDNLLRTTRSGRQPKKNTVFTFAASCRTTTRRRGGSGRGGRRKSAAVTPLRPIVDQAPSDDPPLLSPSQIILVAEKPVSDGSQVIHLLMYNSAPAAAAGATPVGRFDMNVSGGSVSPLRAVSPFPATTEHDVVMSSLSSDQVELQAAVKSLSGDQDERQAAVTSLSSDQVELHVAVTQLTGEEVADVTLSDVAIGS